MADRSFNHTAFIEGVALWTPALPGWDLAAQAFCGHADTATSHDATPRRPAPTALAANERRRAPDSVLVALEVAQAAIAASGRAAHTLASVFTSAYGDLGIVDALCQALALDARQLSPTRFHHSVHNAASGYWAIASGSRQSSTALAAFDHSFGAGLLEAASLCTADQRPVLLVGFDTEARGALSSVNTSRGLLGVALVLAPTATPSTRWRLDWALTSWASTTAATSPSAPHPAIAALAANGHADALPLFEALAQGQSTERMLPVAPTLAMTLELRTVPIPG